MSLFPENITIQQLSPGAQTLYAEVKKFRRADKDLARKIYLSVDSTQLAETRDLALAVLLAAKAANFSIEKTLRYLLVALVQICIRFNQEGLAFLPPLTSSIFDLFGSWYQVTRISALYKSFTRGRGQAFRVMDRAGIKSYTPARVSIDKGLLEGVFRSIEGYPIEDNLKIIILKSFSRFDLYYGYLIDYILNGFWP